MSFHSNYVNFGCHKVMLLIHIKSHYIKNRVYFVFAKASTVQSVNNTILLWSYIYRERDRMTDKDIDACVSR